jgi:adenylate cyclase
MEFTAIGDGVNLGSRLEGASKLYGTDIVISESTYRPCADLIWARELDFIKVKGKNQPVAVYELVGLKSDTIADEKKQVIEHYHKAREHYLKRKFAFAVAEFATVLEIDCHDKAAALHMERCQHWLRNPPSDDWDGSWTLTEK